MGIKTASIHYHFPTKGDLGLALVKRHRQALAKELARIDADEPDPWEQLRRYAGIFRSTLENGQRMCLGGMLAIEYQSLPPELVHEVRGYFGDNEKWLARTLQAGRKARVVAFSRPLPRLAERYCGPGRRMLSAAPSATTIDSTPQPPGTCLNSRHE